MRIVSSVLVCSLALSLISFKASAEEEQEATEEGTGHMSVKFEAPADSAFKSLAESLEASKFFDDMADGVNETYSLPQDLPVYFRQCNTVNAFYDPSKKEMTICYELVARVKAMYDANKENNDQEVDENTLAATAFFFLHEMGHAFVDLMKIPITGKEEDAVDDLAALTLIEAEEDEPQDSSLYNVVDAFDDLSAEYQDIDELPMWDEHSLTQQRLYTMLCLLYGSNSKAHADLIGSDGLPKERAERCAHEYEQKRNSWDTLLSDYIKE